jgi:Uma2 family endonuclease
MQTAATGYDLVLDPAAYEGIELIDSDGVPMDSFWHSLGSSLLIAVAIHWCRNRDDFWVGGNNFIYFNPDQARNLDYRGPDFFFIKNGVDRTRWRAYWAVWEEGGRLPDVIIELVSPTTEKEDRTTKFTIYEQTLRTPEYFIYDPATQQLDGWRLFGSSYAALQPNEQGWLWSEELGLFLGTWIGDYERIRATWLRMFTAEGELAPTGEEAARRHAKYERQQNLRQRKEIRRERQRAEMEQQRADQEKQRAEQAEQELARLRALLQQPPPPKTNGTAS